MTTKVEIFGSEYMFDGDDPEQIRALAEYVNRKMFQTVRSIKNVTTSKVAVTTAMTIAEEMFNLRDSVEQATRNNTARLDKLIAVCERLASPVQDRS